MTDYPRLRPVEAFPVQQEGKTLICLRDPQHLSQPLAVTPAGYFVLSHFDGGHSLVDIQEAYCRRFGDLLFGDDLRKMIELLDAHYYLYSERFLEHRGKIIEEFRKLPNRLPAHVGTVYKQEPEALRSQLDSYFQLPDGPGEPGDGNPQPTPKAVVAPHIDFHRGGACYAWAYKELVQAEGADLYILLGTSHCGGQSPFTSVLKDFVTPLGTVETDKKFVRELQKSYGGDLFAEEYLHRTEHSIEFQVVFLAYVAWLRAERLKLKKPFKIVPILVSSFHPMVQNRTLPEKEARVGDFFRAMRELIKNETRQVCLIAGVDLAHVGMQFGDREPLTVDFLRWVEQEDRALIDKLAALDSEGFFHEVAKDGDRRRICGFSPLYSLMQLLDRGAGRCLKYSQAFTQETGSAVTFTSMVFD
ncbi:MAG: AmmeMemoRadiSam system protein B [Deltaproteobacteria bacterium]|nr:AmmeMemoRadiSam system protein B [Deltaproteobacteria bacterium]